MSILLEALRKTEKNQKKQQVPTIHSEEPVRPGSEPLQAGPVVAMIAVVLIVSSWFVFRQYELPAGVYRPPVTLPVTQAPSGSEQAAVAGNTQAAQRTNDSRPSPAPAQPRTDTSAARQQRTPVETYQAPAASTSGSVAAQDGSSAGRRPSGVTNTPSKVTTKQNAVLDSSRPAAPTAGAASKAAVAAKPDTPHIPEPISYWELPDAVRADVPEIRYSVLVYNKDPAQRFVLIGGQRLGEGDSIQPGLVVEEIRRDGVIFSYRLYKFLVKR